MKKTASKKAEPNPAGSEIIRQSVVYVQAMAAYKAGFTADITRNWDHCGSGNEQLGGKHLREAGHALRRLIAISPASESGRSPLTAQELFAKARVLTVVLDQEGGQTRSLEADETVYVRFFAREVEDHCRAEAATAEKRKTEAGFLSAAAQTVLASIAKGNAS
jgi:hypothetical protein